MGLFGFLFMFLCVPLADKGHIWWAFAVIITGAAFMAFDYAKENNANRRN